MARKTLRDFNNDYDAYAKYLQSAECADDDGYDVFVDEKGNIYERINGSWKNGHSHENVFNDYKRSLEDPSSQGRKWENRW